MILEQIEAPMQTPFLRMRRAVRIALSRRPDSRLPFGREHGFTMQPMRIREASIHT
jgi:hypothetical protein